MPVGSQFDNHLTTLNSARMPILVVFVCSFPINLVDITFPAPNYRNPLMQVIAQQWYSSLYVDPLGCWEGIRERRRKNKKQKDAGMAFKFLRSYSSFGNGAVVSKWYCEL